MTNLKTKLKDFFGKISIWIKKPQNSIILFSIIGIIIFLTVIPPILLIISISLENIFSFINLILISLFSSVLALIEIRKYLKGWWNKNKFEIECIGRLSAGSALYFYVIIKNKTNEVALNCRGNLIIEGHHNSDTVWADPSHPREIDIPLREKLDLFCKIRDTILIPSGTVGRYSKYQVLRQVAQLKSAQLENSWQEGAHITIYPYNLLKSKSLTILITARNANPMELKLKTIQDIVKTLNAKDTITKDELEKNKLLI